MKKFLRTLMLTAAMLLPFASQAQQVQTFDFEDNAIPAAWTNDTVYPWTVTDAPQGSGHQGTYCIMSGNGGVSSSQSAITATFTFAGDGSISFLAGIFGEGTSTAWDKCIFKIDGVQQFAYGALGTWAVYSYEIEAGTHTFEWRYTKDGSVNPTGDAFFLDSVVVDLGVAGGCPRPGIITVSNLAGTSADISWLAGGSESSWNIYIDSVFETSVTTPNYSITGLSGETTYEVSVEANCGTSTSNWRSTTFTTLITCPAPTGLAAVLTPGDGTVATLNWTENGTATTWELLYSTDADFTGVAPITVTGTPTYSLTGLTAETTLYAKVRAICDVDDESTWTSTISFTPTDAYSLTVNDGTTTNSYVPIYGMWVDNHTKSQFIIPATDLTGMVGSVINKLTFYCSSSSINWGAAEFAVYMTGTTDNTISALVDETSMSLVRAQGSLSVSNNIMEVILTVPYYYAGGNLLIAFDQPVSGTYVSSSWYGVSATSGASWGGYGTSVSAKSFLPKITFDFAPSTGDICLPVMGLTASDITTDGATISWSGSANSYTIYDLTDTSLVATVTDTFYTFTNLNPMTAYSYGVIANCANDESIMMSVTFNTACTSVTLPYTESFEPTSAALNCWSLSNTAANTGLTSSNPYDGSYSFIFAYNTNPPQYLISPELSGADDGLMVSFMYRIHSTSYPESFQLGYSTTTSDITAFNWGTEQTNLLNLTYEPYSEILPAGVKYVAIKYTANDMYYLYIDSMVFQAVSGDFCFPVADLTAGNATINSIDLSWSDASNTGATYTIYNMADTSVVASNVSGTTYTVTGLATANVYTFGVVTNCSATSASNFVTVSASTSCGDITTLPYTEDFENGLVCWSTVNGSTDAQPWSAYNTNGLTGIDAHSGSYVASSWSWSNSTAMHSNAWLISPKFILPNTNDSITLSWWELAAANYPDSYSVVLSTTTSDTAAFTTVLRPHTAAAGDWTMQSVNLTQYAGQSVYIAFHHVDYDMNYLFIDDITISEGAATAAGVSITFAVNDATMGTTVPAPGTYTYALDSVLSVTAVPAAGYHLTDWEISMYIPDYGNYTTSVGTNDLTITDTVSEDFDGITITAIFAQDVNCPDSVTIPFFEGFETGIDCWSMVNTAANTGAAIVEDYAYQDSGFFYFVYNTNPPQYLITPRLAGTGNGVEVEFYYQVMQSNYPESFQIGYSTTTNDTSAFVWGPEQTNLTNTTYAYYSEVLAAPGIKYVAIKYTANDMYYLFIDNFEVHEAPSCFPVSNLNVTASTSTSISLSWTDANTGATYTLYNMADTSVIASNISGTSYTVTGLATATTYTFGVVANCSATDVSNIVTIDASTECDVITVYPYTQDFSVVPACWSAIDADGDGYGWELLAGAMHSASYDNNDGVLTPDNWLITPQFQLTANTNYEVTWNANPQDASWPAEHYGLYVSTGYPDTSAFVLIQEWTLTSAGHTPVINLSSYAGQTIYLAFRHWNCSDMYQIAIDNFELREAAGANQVTVTLTQNNPMYGSVSGSGVYTIGDNVTVTATPADNYVFTRWADVTGATVSTANPYTFVATTDVTLQAIFVSNTAQTYTITVDVNDSTMGYATGSGEYTSGDVAVLTAYPYEGYRFVNWTWNDMPLGTDNPMSMTVTTNSSAYPIVANFEPDTAVVEGYLTLITAVNNPNMGTITPAPGTHQYVVGDVIEFSATAYEGYHYESVDVALSFMGITLMDTTVTEELEDFDFEVVEDLIGVTLSITVNFMPDQVEEATLTVNVNNPNMGYVLINGDQATSYTGYIGEVVTLKAVANNGFHFDGWSDGQTSDTRTFELTEATNSITANFAQNQAIDLADMVSNLNVYPNPTFGVVTVDADNVVKVEVLDINGRLVTTIENNNRLDLSSLSAGTYMLRIQTTNGTAVKRVIKK